MQAFSVGPSGRMITLSLDPGDGLLESIMEAIEELNIQNGVVVSGIGSLTRARWHVPIKGEDTPMTDVFYVREGIIEIQSIQGIIANGRPHIHITLSENQVAFGGHLEEGCKVAALCEIMIIEAPEARYTHSPINRDGVSYKLLRQAE